MDDNASFLLGTSDDDTNDGANRNRSPKLSRIKINSVIFRGEKGLTFNLSGMTQKTLVHSTSIQVQHEFSVMVRASYIPSMVIKSSYATLVDGRIIFFLPQQNFELDESQRWQRNFIKKQ
jgi:hypothetical protein